MWITMFSRFLYAAHPNRKAENLVESVKEKSASEANPSSSGYSSPPSKRLRESTKNDSSADGLEGSHNLREEGS